MANDSENSLVVSEIFHSIQGESTWAGLPCTFVRLTGCPLRCSYCDTQYAYEAGIEMSIIDVVARCQGYGGTLVEITGGEPLAQAACGALAENILALGITVLVETSGSLPINTLPLGVIRIMDLKCPGSGMCERNNWDNIAFLTCSDEVKFVISDRADYEWSRETIERYTLAVRCKQVLVSPALDRLEPRLLVEWLLEDKLPARFQLQLHKYIWPIGQKGV